MTAAASIPTRANGFRHSGMHERVEGLGGHYTVESSAGTGTCVRITHSGLKWRQCMTSVLIIDDHPIVLQGCRRVLEDAGVETVLDARDIASGYRLYRRHNPDVVIVDLSMQGSGLGGLPLIRRIRAHDPRTRILVFSMHSDPIIVARALEAGATGYVLKDTSSDELRQAFDKVRAGTPYLSNDIAMQVALVRTGARRNPLVRSHAARVADAVAAGRGQALWPHRRRAQRQLQDRGQPLLAAQAEARRPQPAGADPHCRAALGSDVMSFCAIATSSRRIWQNVPGLATPYVRR